MNHTLLIIGGIFHFSFAVFHLFFWQLFNWEKDLASLTFVNRAIMQILNLCLTFVFVAVGYISIFYASELLTTKLGKAILTATFLFWFLRAVEQIVFFGVKETRSNILTIIFAVGFIIYLIPIL